MDLLLGQIPNDLCLIFYGTLGLIYQCHRQRADPWNVIFLQLPYLQRYKDALVEKGTPLHNCFGFVDGTVARICRPVFNKRMVCKGHTRVHDIQFHSVVLRNVLIINCEEQWEGRIHDCVLYFMNWFY